MDIAIIGAGPAGLTAAMYAARLGMNTYVFDKALYGGQALISSKIENYPAIKDISGADFAIKLYEQVKSLGIEFIFEEVINLNLNGSEKIITTTEKSYRSRALIIATGAKRKKLDCKGEDKFIGNGVSYCATCDGSFFKGKNVAIVGGGNTALEDALLLSNTCNNVTIINKNNKFKGEELLIEAVKKQKNININYNCIVEEIIGDKTITSLKIKSLTNNTFTNISINGVFVAIGLQPDTNLVKDFMPLDKNGYIIADETCKTNINGVFVAGDCRTKLLRQIITAAADGAVSAYLAADFSTKF